MNANVATVPEPAAKAAAGKPRIHLDFLDGIRACAALTVMTTHALHFLPLPSGVESSVIAALSFTARIAVDIFILLSGFCLMLPIIRDDGILKGGKRQFFIRRIRRILPPYYAALALSLLLIWTLIGHKTGTLWDISFPVTKRAILAHILLLQNIYDSSKINGVFWSIAVESQIYLCFPAFILLTRRIGAKKSVGLALVLSYLATFLIQHTRFYGLTIQYWGLFALGTLGAAICFGKDTEWSVVRQRTFWGPLTFVLGLMLFCLWTWFSCHNKSDTYHIFDYLTGCWGMCLLVNATCCTGSRSRAIFEKKPLVFIGAFSYSLYLIHFPVQQCFWQYVIRPLHFDNTKTIFLLVTAGSMVAIGVAYLFHLAFERPFMSGFRKQTGARESVWLRNGASEAAWRALGILRLPPQRKRN
jgi:peptidoglycan/LPS O-acetylase OafA/YrhL